MLWRLLLRFEMDMKEVEVGMWPSPAAAAVVWNGHTINMPVGGMV